MSWKTDKSPSKDIGWKEEEELSEARQKLEEEFDRKRLELDLQLEEASKKVEDMVIETLKVKEAELDTMIDSIKIEECEVREKNRKSMEKLTSSIRSMDISDIEEWAFSAICPLNREDLGS